MQIFLMAQIITVSLLRCLREIGSMFQTVFSVLNSSFTLIFETTLNILAIVFLVLFFLNLKQVSMVETIRWTAGSIRILDQTELPEKEIYLIIETVDELIEAIKKLRVRGAPALGIAGAFGVVLGISKLTAKRNLDTELTVISEKIIGSRPTAVNLQWGVKRILNKILEHAVLDFDDIKRMAEKEALVVLNEDIERCKTMGSIGAKLIANHRSVLTHCNTGGLATGGFGTALGVIVTAHAQNRGMHVYVDETRPLQQGARLTAWELQKENIDHTVITDNMAGYLMSQEKIDSVLVGADRIASNGDTANKIGTYTLAVLCEKHKIPFYVVAPTSTIDSAMVSGKDIPIEERETEEITHIKGHRIVASGSRVYNPAFDVTPGYMISAIITEKKIFSGPHYNFADACFN